LSKNGDRRDEATQTKAPEKVVEDPPPEPDYPRYRIEPGIRAGAPSPDVGGMKPTGPGDRIRYDGTCQDRDKQ
jgi:hypothetical protein